MIRLFLILLVAFALLVVFQDAPPVARLLAQGPPEIPRALRQVRDACTGTAPSPAARPDLSHAAAQVGQFIDQAGQKTGDAARQVEGEIQQQIDAHPAPVPAPAPNTAPIAPANDHQ